MHTLIKAVLLPAAGFIAFAGAASGWSADLPGAPDWRIGVDLRYDDNLGLAPDSDSERDQVTHRVSAGVGWQPLQTARNELDLGADVFYDAMSRFRDLNRYGLDLSARYLQQFSEGITSPWVAISVGGTWQEHNDSDLRDGYEFESEVAVGRRFNAAIGGSVGYRYRQRWSTEDDPKGALLGRDSDEVFDHRNDGPFIRLEVLPTPRSTVFLEYNYMSGDVASTASPSGFINPAEFPAARDFAFEQGIGFLVWKVDADQDIYSFGGDYTVTERITVNLSGSYLDAKAESGNDYTNWMVSLGAAFNF
jgi:hypothetical protein